MEKSPRGRPADNVTTGEILRDMSEEISQVKNTVEKIEKSHREQKLRTSQIWDAVFGVKIEGHEVPGLAENMRTVMPVIKTMSTMIAVGKWIAVTFIGAAIVGLANLVVFCQQSSCFT